MSGAPLILKTYCTGSKCDPCATSDLYIVGNMPGETCWVVANNYITSFPEFPLSVTAAIDFLGIADPVTNQILHPGSGSTGTGGTSNSLGVSCPLPQTPISIPGYNLHAGIDGILLFKVACTSSTTIGATLEVGTVNVESKSGGYFPARWTGNVS